MFTTYDLLHGPEIAYLENGINGIMTSSSVSDYAGAVSAALESSARLDLMAKACLQSARTYDLVHMVESFADGVVRCLNSRRRGHFP
jgi:hypothetical protein